MNKLFYIIFVCIGLSTFTSCEKVIDLDLNSGDPKYVIEGMVNKDSSVHTIRITRTLNFDENTSYPTVDNAVVSLQDNLGNATTLALVAPGTYQTSAYPGVEGRTYTLTVTVDGKTFTSSSTMPTHVPMDTITLADFGFGPTPTFYPIANRFDPVGVRNYYRFDLYKNNEFVNGIFLQDDQFSDGVEVLEPIFGGDYESGDTLGLTLYCIDANVHKYFYTLSVNAGGTGGATPANPESNFGSACLGYFSAQTKQTKSIIVP